MNINEIISRSIDCHMNDVYKRIINGDLIATDGNPVPIESYDNLIAYFEKTEDYEMCAIILKRKKDRLNHNQNFYNPIKT